MGIKQKSPKKGEPRGEISFDIARASMIPEKIAEKTCKNMQIIILFIL